MKSIHLTQGKVAIVDDDDYDRVSKYKWSAMYSKKTESYYAARTTRAKAGAKTVTVRMHRFIMRAKKGVVVDHSNHDTLDNRKNNLTVCTHSQNMMNRRGATKASKTCIRGVYWLERLRKFRAMIRVKGKLKHLGLFSTPGEAADAYWAANRKHFGKYGGKRPSNDNR